MSGQKRQQSHRSVCAWVTNEESQATATDAIEAAASCTEASTIERLAYANNVPVTYVIQPRRTHIMKMQLSHDVGAMLQV